MSNATSTTTPPAARGRRAFLGRSFAAVAGVAAAGLLSTENALAVTPALTFADIPGTGDAKVLNYALALEDLEADLYVQALQRLTSGGRNGVGKTITGLNLKSKEIDVAYLNEFALVEAQHRDFLRGSLRKAAISPFKYDFGIQSMSRQQVLTLVYTAEALGVSAYLGAIPFFANRKYLRAAGAIQGTEARHTAVLAAVRNVLFKEGIAVAPLAGSNNGRDNPMTPDSVLAAVSGFIVV